jgi:hypothetical protein
MPRVKVKTSKRALNDKGVVNMFNQMLGTDDADPAIIAPKYKKIRKKIESFSKIVTAATEDVFIKSFPEQEQAYIEIFAYANKLNSIEFVDFPDDVVELRKMSKEVSKEYAMLKDNNHIKTMILTCRNLVGYKAFLTGSVFDDSFIARIPGLVFAPFSFSCLNLKEIWASPNITERIKKYIFAVLKIILSSCMEVYKIITSPDVDVAAFSKVIISSIAQVKKQIPRCDQAFAKIQESVGMLENNFDGYYKDFVQSKNPSTIIESFVIDVSQSGGGDSRMTRQFRKIISHYRKLTQGKIKDPKINKVFDLLNSNMDMMGSDTARSESPDAEEKSDAVIEPKRVDVAPADAVENDTTANAGK